MSEIAVLTLGMDMEWENIERDTGYKPITTFYEDLTKAEKFRQVGVKTQFDEIFHNERKACEQGDVKRMTELSLVTNWKMWDCYKKTDLELSALYELLWRKVDKFCLDNFKGKDLSYYLNTTD